MHIILNSKGFTLIEAMIAVLLTMVGAIAVLSLQPQAWMTAGKADHIGRAAGVMQTELELRENQIMLGTIPASPINQTFQVSGGGNHSGDATFNIITTTTNPGANRWLVNVRVTWPGNCSGGTCNISSSMLVTRQAGF